MRQGSPNAALISKGEIQALVTSPRPWKFLTKFLASIFEGTGDLTNMLGDKASV